MNKFNLRDRVYTRFTKVEMMGHVDEIKLNKDTYMYCIKFQDDNGNITKKLFQEHELLKCRRKRKEQNANVVV